MSLFEQIGYALFKNLLKEEKYDDKVLKEISELSDDQDSNIRFFKDAETGKLRWIAAWSSNYEDDDTPSDIISEEAHKSFLESVEKGELPYPELWHWHTKGTKWGESDWLAYDEDYGINWASGTVDEGHEKEALSLMKCGIEIGVSHGMKDIKRDSHDNKVITQYVTYEISDLPLRWAANKMTALFIAENNSTEDNMTLKNEKKDFLKKVGLSDEEINELDKFGKEQAGKFSDRSRKDKEADIEDDVENKDEPTEQPSEELEDKENADEESEKAEGDNGEEPEAPEEDAEEKEAEKDFDPSEFVTTIKDVVRADFEKFGEEVVKALEKIDSRIDGLEKANEAREKREKEKELEPMSTSIFNRLSAIGSKEAEVEEGELKDAPKETEAEEGDLGGAQNFSQFLSKNLFRDE